MRQIDLNCDLGESFGPYKMADQHDILKYISSANIACGFHSGDPTVMRETVEVALKHDVKIGAHPGLPDLIGFGRRDMKISAQDAYDIVVYQVGALQGVLDTFDEKMQHVKPHGALYNMAARDQELAEAIAQAVYDVSPSLILYGLSKSELTKAGEKVGLTTIHEVFADRTYQADGTLTSRSLPHAVITDTNHSIEQILSLVKEGKVRSLQASDVYLSAHTICVHGDGENALTFVQQIKQALEHHDIEIKAPNLWKDRI